MADIQVGIQEQDPKSTQDHPAFILGQALYESAKGASKPFTETFPDDVRFALGENQWPTPSNYRALQASKWKSRTVFNKTFSAIHHKISQLLAADASYRADPLDELSTLEERKQIAFAVEHEMGRIGQEDNRRDALWDGCCTGKGLTYFYCVQDDFTGLYQIKGERVDGRRAYPDPSVTRAQRGRFFVYEPEMDMSLIRSVFKDTWKSVQVGGNMVGALKSDRISRTDDELVYGPPGTWDFSLTKEGILKDRKADVALLFIRDMNVIIDVKEFLMRGEAEGFLCTLCGYNFEKMEALQDGPNEKPRCPECGTSEISAQKLQPTFWRDVQKRREYPRGRLIAMTKDALLYDGPASHMLDQTSPTPFPIGEYTHYPVSDRYWGYGEVAHLKEAQKALNKNIAQALDFMRRAGNGPLEVPAEVSAYRYLGNRPDDVVPVPAAYMGLARHISPTGYNTVMHQILHQQLTSGFDEYSGVNSAARGDAPLNPSSGRLVLSLQNASGGRIGDNLRLLTAYDSQCASIGWQMMSHYYTEPRAYVGQDPVGDLTAEVIEVASLPRNVSIRVEASLEKQQKEENFGQNITSLATAGLIPFYPDLVLPTMGAPRDIAREYTERMKADPAWQAQEQAKQAMAMGAAGGGSVGAPSPGPGGPSGVPPPPALTPGELQMEGGTP